MTLCEQILCYLAIKITPFFFYLPQLPATQIPSPGMYEEFLSTAINFQRDLGDPTASFLLENILNKVNLWPDFPH